MRKLAPVWPAALLVAAVGVTLYAAILKMGGPYVAVQPAAMSAALTPQDIVMTSGFPAIAGLGFALFGALLQIFFPGRPGGLSLPVFHYLFAAVLVGFAGVPLGLRWEGAGWPPALSLLPAAMLHAALQFPPPERKLSTRPWILAAYSLGGALALACLFGAFREPAFRRAFSWGIGAALGGLTLFWLIRAALAAGSSGSEAIRGLVRWLLAGQIAGFLLPLACLALIRWRGFPVPGTVLAPATLLFPLCLCFGLLAAELRQSRWQLVQTEKMATMGNLLAGLAHEINNPLTFIYSNLDPMRESLAALRAALADPEGKGAELFAELAATLDTMEEGATRAKEIIENLRYFAYPGRREKSPVDLNRVLEHDIALLAPKWKGRLRIVRSFGEIPKVEGLAGDLGQAFLNVLANACDATPKRGVIRVRSWREGEREVTVAVRDSGMGIAKEVLPRIFDPFFTTKEQGEGTGLGLAIALQIVQKHRGRIEVKSEPGKGTELRVTLPLAAAPTPREVEDAVEASISARREV